MDCELCGKELSAAEIRANPLLCESCHKRFRNSSIAKDRISETDTPVEQVRFRSLRILIFSVLSCAIFGAAVMVSGNAGGPSYAKGLAELAGLIKYGGIGLIVGFVFATLPRTRAPLWVPMVVSATLIGTLGWSDFRQLHEYNRYISFMRKVESGHITADSLVADWKKGNLPDWKRREIGHALIFSRSVSEETLEYLWERCRNDDRTHSQIIKHIISRHNCPEKLLRQIHAVYAHKEGSPATLTSEFLFELAKAKRTPNDILVTLAKYKDHKLRDQAIESLRQRQRKTEGEGLNN